MPRYRLLPPSVIAALFLTGLPAATLAQAIPAACKPLVDAELKVLSIPHHAYVTQGPPNKASAQTKSEMITVGGVNYLLYQGKWSRSPMSAQDQLDQMHENIKNTKAMSCHREGEQQVGGQSAIVYTTHTESDAGKDDARLWIAKGSGLPLQVDEDLDAGVGGADHMNIRYEYANVRAPAVQ